MYTVEMVLFLGLVLDTAILSHPSRELLQKMLKYFQITQIGSKTHSMIIFFKEIIIIRYNSQNIKLELRKGDRLVFQVLQVEEDR